MPILMTPELAQSLATIRLRQTAQLLARMAESAGASGPPHNAHELVTEALGIVERHPILYD